MLGDGVVRTNTGIRKIEWFRGDYLPSGMGEDICKFQVELLRPLGDKNAGSIAYSSVMQAYRQKWGREEDSAWTVSSEYTEGIECQAFTKPSKKKLTVKNVARWLDMYIRSRHESEDEEESEEPDEIDEEPVIGGRRRNIDRDCDIEVEDEEKHDKRSWREEIPTEEFEVNVSLESLELPDAVKCEVEELDIDIEDGNDLILLSLLPIELFEALKALKLKTTVSTLPNDWTPVQGSSTQHTIVIEVEYGRPVEDLFDVLEAFAGALGAPFPPEKDENDSTTTSTSH